MSGQATTQQLVNQMRQDLQILSKRIQELEGELDEYSLTIATLESMDGERLCFRQMGDALIERKVGDVLPELQKVREGLVQLIRKMQMDYQTKEEEISKFAEKK
ncbi:hypothetical protein H696_06051 [Fonticula alba]|uniref:Prefoldin subunit 2 n=1 Tax=Fonticula alba TaxID=691883 RepID=A0A058Z0V2_FONAL|nr:hypothetical protein H696_06051 [Fonticula alba]KCV67533.1 hypothetical protein H696_06051 [Fonticula alba]|eukprot:XP_009498094.1 hypothetical protein H696_06051 [Fonticula alba]